MNIALWSAAPNLGKEFHYLHSKNSGGLGELRPITIADGPNERELKNFLCSERTKKILKILKEHAP
jgi:hypothetical protein